MSSRIARDIAGQPTHFQEVMLIKEVVFKASGSLSTATFFTFALAEPLASGDRATAGDSYPFKEIHYSSPACM